MGSFFEDIGLDMTGESHDVPLPDVSRGAAAEQPTTPTGTGTGYYVDGSWQSAIFGTLGQALNYALQRDQAKFAAEHGYTPGPAQMTPTPQAAAAMGNSKLILYGAIALGAVLILSRR